jgi:hypothetical protein
MRIESFDMAAREYESIRPVVSKYHPKEQDVRPLGNRAAKHNRIIKVSDHCYALVDQGNKDDTLWQDGKPTPASVVDWAPIVWTRELVNTSSVIEKNRWADFIQVRGVRWGHDMQRLRFMREYLPHVLSDIGSGYVWFDGKWTAVPWQPPAGKLYNGESDNFLRFKRTGYGYAVLENVGRTFVHPKAHNRIDKELKAKIKPHMDSFYEWICAMAPLLPQPPRWGGTHSNTDEYRQDYHNRVQKYREYRTNNSNKLLKAGLVRSAWNAKKSFIPKKVIEAIVTENTELRLALASLFLEDSELQSCKTKEDFKYARTQYNRWINKVCGLVKTTYDEEGS